MSNLPRRTQKYLQDSWAEVFRREVFLRIREDRFAVLYDAVPSRPNVPVNLLVGLEVLKEWRGWSDEELYEHFLFDLQVRYAVGCDNFGEGDFDLRTLYYFRRRLNEHAIKTGENLMKVAFESITDEQIEKFNVETKVQRMDSAQILSNIADLSRLQLLVEALQRLHRFLSPEDQAKYQMEQNPYLRSPALADHYERVGLQRKVDPSCSEFYVITPKEGEVIIPKYRYSGFVSTYLDRYLRSNGIKTLVLVGLAPNVCVESTARDGFMRDYHIIFPEDMTEGTSPEAKKWSLFNIGTFFGEVVDSKDLLDCWGLKA